MSSPFRSIHRRPAPWPRLSRALLLAAVAAFALILPGVPPAGAADEVAVIVNSANPVASLSVAEVSNLFLKKGKASWPSGEKVLPIDLLEKSPVREAFSRKFHGKGTSSVKAYWQKQIFSGRDVPPPEKSAADVIAFVRANPGGIGYVPAGSALGSGVKVLATD